MKPPLIALAGALASANASVKNIKLGNHQLRRGDVTEALLKNAVPFKARRLDGAAEANMMDGSYSISFGKCIDIKTKSEDLFSGSFIDQVQNGNALSLKSFVVFYACQDANGYGCSEADSSVYLVDLPTYMSVVGTKQVYQRNDFCEQCENKLDFCTANNGAYEADVDYDDNMNDDYNNYMNDDAVNEAEAEEQQDEGNEEQKEENQQQDNGEQKEENQQQNQQNNGEQKEENKQQGNENQKGEEGGGRKLKQQIDCSRCNELQCFDKYADDDTVVNQAAIRDEIDTNIGAWIEEVANCKATNEVIDGQPVYIGPICSDYADTFEIGAFLDEDCSIYTKLASFGDIAIAEKANYNVDVVGYAINSLKTAFYEPMTCEAQDFAEGDDEEEDEEENEMSDYCTQLLQQDAINFNECAADQEQQYEGDDAYNWYSYDLEYADEVEEVCAKIVSFSGDYSNYYDSKFNGSVHTRNRKGKLVTGKNTLSVGATVAIVLACIVVVGAACSLLKPRRVKAPALHEPVYGVYQGSQHRIS